MTILNLAYQGVFLVESTSTFFDRNGNERFSLTFEVNGLVALEALHREFSEKKIRMGDIEDRGHSGRNFVFYDLDGNKFDVWSEWSPIFKENYSISKNYS